MRGCNTPFSARNRDKKNPLAGDDYLADSDEELEGSKPKEVEVNCNEIIDRYYDPQPSSS